jgi:predicted outer membrane protein
MTKSIIGILPVLWGGRILSAATNLNGNDVDFVNNTANGGTTEVEPGHLVVRKSKNPEVWHFAGRMVRDHSKIDIKLTPLASSKGVQTPGWKTSDERCNIAAQACDQQHRAVGRNRHSRRFQFYAA